MANEYSVEIHQYISAKIAKATREIKKAEETNDAAAGRYYGGQLYELVKI